jgi:hypothetical protein
MSWESIFPIVLLIAIIYAVKERLQDRAAYRAKKNQAPAFPAMPEQEVQQHLENLSEDQKRQVQLQQMYYRSAPEWYLLDPALREAILSEFAPRVVVKNGKATTEDQAARFVARLRERPETSRIEYRLTHRTARSLPKSQGSYNKNGGSFNKQERQGHMDKRDPLFKDQDMRRWK